jgi:hypothetical protein
MHEDFGRFVLFSSFHVQKGGDVESILNRLCIVAGLGSAQAPAIV